MYPQQQQEWQAQGGPQGPGWGAPQQPQAWGNQPPQGWAPPPTQAAPQPPQPPARPAVTPPPPDELMAGGYKGAKFPDGQFGHVVGGEIIAAPETVQQRDFDSGQPKFYDDGNPMWQIVVPVQAEPATADDDGIRAFYIKAQMKQAVQQALRKAGAARLEVGGVLQIRYVRDEPNSRGRGKDKKIYEARYVPPPAMSEADLAAATSTAVDQLARAHASSPVLNKPAGEQSSFDDVPPF